MADIDINVNIDAQSREALKKALEEVSRELSPKSGKNVMRRSFAEMGRRFLAAIKEMVPIRSGKLKKALAVSTRVYPDGVISATVKAKFPKGAHWHFTEFGTAHHPAANGGRGYVRPAFDDNEQKIADEAIDIIWKQIAKSWERGR